MKKFLIIIGLFCGFIGDSWAECVLTESTDRTPSDEDLYPQNPYDESRMALVCETGKCEDGEVVFAKAGHYRKNTLVNKDVFYKCNAYSSRARNDRWVAIDIDNHLPACDDDISGKEGLAESLSGVTLGRKQADNLYTDICWKKYEFDNLCGVECNSQTVDKIIYCDSDIATCNRENQYKYVWRGYGYGIVGVMCPYTDPKTRDVGNYTVSMYLFVDSVDDGQSWAKLFGTRKLKNGQDLGDPKDFCIGCDAGFYSGGDWGCYNNEDKAWCNWRKHKENKNTEWKDGACNCLDSGMKWDAEKLDCVKKKGGGKTGGGKTSGKTGSSSGKTGSGSGKTGGGKIGSGSGKIGGGTTSDTKCGVKCNKKTSGKWISCDYEFFTCFDNNDDSNRVIEWQKLHPDFMVIEPCLLLDPSTPKGDNQAMSVYVGDYHNNDTVAIFNKKQDGSFVEETDLCFLCEGEYKYFDIARLNHKDGKECTNNEQLAWCNWRKVKENINTNWQNGECKCLDTGRKWSNDVHNCVPETEQSKDDKKLEQENPEQKNTNTDCVIKLEASVRCKDGSKFSKTATLSVTSEKCSLYRSNVATYLDEIAGLLCEKSGGVDNMLTDTQVKNAADNLDRFFTNAEANASVWKNAEGKFNTARLASDATAGVILGTVGGIVSANIIKKKQVEKGFDALNCTIGGQKVAGWGDEFTVGLHR